MGRCESRPKRKAKLTDKAAALKATNAGQASRKQKSKAKPKSSGTNSRKKAKATK
jgi:hypothetical protein